MECIPCVGGSTSLFIKLYEFKLQHFVQSLIYLFSNRFLLKKGLRDKLKEMLQ